MRARTSFRFLPFYLLVVVASSAHAQPRTADAFDYEIVIRNGRVLDGAGNPWIAADIGIRDGRFAAIGRIVIEDGRHTGERPGHVLYGPGRK